MSYKKETIRFFTGFFFVFSLWFLISQIINKSFLPDPFGTLIYLTENFIEKDLYFDFIVSFKRIVISLFLSFIVGFPIGIITGINKIVDNIMSPILYFFYPLPKIVFLPLFFVFFGISEVTRIVLIVFILVFQIIVSVRDSVKNINYEYIELFKTLGARPFDYYKLYIPFAAPGAFSSIRVSTGMAIAVLFITENFIADRGLGYLILNAMELRNYFEMYSGIILMGFLGYFFYFLIDYLEIKVCFWQKSMIE
jgi:NitT/TauT family transport system permease protein